jgi:ferrous iron transport protein A
MEGVSTTARDTIRIRDLKIGQKAEIVGYEGGYSPYRTRLLSMGLTRGERIELIKIAPMGDPVELRVRGFNLSLRKQEASVLILSPVER